MQFSDTTMERNTLMAKCYPKIKDYCREKHGLEFQVNIFLVLKKPLYFRNIKRKLLSRFINKLVYSGDDNRNVESLFFLRP